MCFPAKGFREHENREVVAYDLSKAAIKGAETIGAGGARTLNVEEPFSDKLLAAMRSRFGGHAVKRVGE